MNAMNAAHSRASSASARERVLRAVLTSPLAMRLKAQWRDIVWSKRGAGLSNPPLPVPVRSILVLCLGNICRSPFAAAALEDLVARTGGSIRVTSAGIRATQAAKPPETACLAATRHGIRLADHRPQPLTRQLIDAADLVVVMEAAQLDQLRSAYPDAAPRIVLLSLFDETARGAYDRYNIADPYGKPLDVFERCYDRIRRAVDALHDELCRQHARAADRARARWSASSHADGRD